MVDLQYEHPRLAAIYDDSSPWSEDREFYRRLGDGGRKRILDLGCGTGLICRAYAERGHDVTGVDPADSMLAVAAGEPFGDRVRWHHGLAQDFASDDRFDLVIMTGHAFQVLLADEDIAATFAMVWAYLEVGGRFVFESRNPDHDWPAEWNTDKQFGTDADAFYERRRVTKVIRDRIEFEVRYEFADETLVSHSDLRFLSDAQIREFLSGAGLCVTEMYGDWDGAAFAAARSREMIYICERV